MKKQILLVLAVAIISVLTASAQNAVVLLQHKGNTKVYKAEELANAVSAAAAGDTIYLNKGTFGNGNDITITQPITIIGAGGNDGGTYVKGYIDVAINGTPTLTATLLESLKIENNVFISEPLSGLKLKRVSLNSFEPRAIYENGVLESCYIRTYFYGTDDYTLNCTVLNSKINCFTRTCTNVTFVNCNMYTYDSSSYYFKGTVLNSIINSFNYVSSPASFTNCLYYNLGGGVLTDCYKDSNSSLLNNKCECTYNKNSLMSKGYLGNDGTVVGIDGGTSPFTLDPVGPVVESATVKVDVAAQKLNVSLKVKAN